jgi:pilus assembly protein CpaB
MKLVTVGLFAVGVVAAVSAAALVASMQGGSDKTAAPVDSSVVVAAHDLPALAVIDEGALITRTVKAGLAPSGSFADPVQLIGKVLTAPVHAGQALTADSFAADGSASRFAAALPAGRRAVNVTLTDPNAASLLYPGCFVDVLATMRITRASGAERPVTVTLLQGVSVLAVGRQTIVSPNEPDAKADASHAADRPSVALLVDSHQAELLKLAMEEGNLSLVLRNPNDSDTSAVAGADMAALVPMRDDAPPPVQPTSPNAAPVPAPAPLPMPIFEDPTLQTWDVTVLHGSERENHTFVLPNPPKR